MSPARPPTGYDVVLDIFVPLATDNVFSQLVLEQMLAGVATDGPPSVGRLGDRPPHSAIQMSGRGPPLKLYKDRDNLRALMRYIPPGHSKPPT
ncbi:MAG: hypothetical protein WAK86_07940 [Pseudonocardiaceae bacterium]